MSTDVSRRTFLFGAFAATTPLPSLGGQPSLKRMGYKSPNEKLNIAGIGAGGQAYSDLNGCSSENIVALADVDWKRSAQGFERWSKATKYKDFRKMLDKEAKNIDAVVIAIPDHMHATAALPCMQLGKHVYLEKPLTRTPWEARLLTRAAEKYKVATQMGNQGYSHDATRVAAEIIWSGEIGEVKEVHGWMARAVWPQSLQRVPPPTPVPSTLDWDLWLGGAAWREFTAGDDAYKSFVVTRRGDGFAFPGSEDFGFYLPFNWRGFFDFGTGLIGDWGIHIFGPANWGLALRDPISVECVRKEGTSPYTFPEECTIKYEFGARGSMPPVTVSWYNKPGDAYLPPGMTMDEARKIPDTGPQVGPPRRPLNFPGAGPSSGYNCIFVGSKGYLGTNGRGEGVGLLPGARWADYQLPPAYLQRSPGASTGDNHSAHCRDWIRACKGGAPACSDFRISGPYAEWMVLGAIAVRFEGKLLWDAARMRFTNNEAANAYVKPLFRKGWDIHL